MNNSKYYQSEKTGKDIDSAVEDVLMLKESVATIESDIKNLKDTKAEKTSVPQKTGDLVDNTTQHTYDAKSISPQSGQAVAQAIAQLIGSAPEALDTLEELANALEKDKELSATIIETLSNKVDKKEGKGLSTNDFTDSDEYALDVAANAVLGEPHQVVVRRNDFKLSFNDDSFETDSINNLYIYDDEIKQWMPVSSVTFKDSKAREMIGDIEDGKANVFSMSAKGENINIKDSADNKLNSLKIYGRSKQNIYSGKNLFRILETPQTKVGVTLSYDKTDDTFVLNGTSTSSVSFEVVPKDGNYGEIKANDYYTLSFEEVSGSKSNAAHIFVGDSVNTGTYFALSTLNSNKKQTKKYDSDCYITRFVINVSAADITYTNYKFRIQFEKGQSNTPFEPYVGGKASPSPDYPQEIINPNEINFNIINKNFLSEDVYDLSNWSNPSQSGSTPTQSYDYFSLSLPAGTYVIDITLIDNTKKMGYLYLKRYENNKWETTKYNGVSNTFTVDTSIRAINYRTFTIEEGYDYKLWWYGAKKNDFTNLSTIQIRRVNDTAVYEPQVKQTLIIPDTCRGIPVSANGNYTDEKGQQWMCDEIDFARGKYVQRIGKYFLTGNESWIVSNVQNAYKEGFTRYDASVVAPLTSSENCLWTHFQYKGRSFNDGFGAWVIPDGKTKVALRIVADFATVDDLKAWLADKATSGEPVIVLYILAEPIETQLTEEQIFAYKALQTYKPVTNIYTLEGAGIEVDYDTDLQSYIDAKFAELQQAIISMGGNV